MTEDLWMIEYESIQEGFASGRLDLDDVRLKLHNLGFGAAEIEDHIFALGTA